MTAGFEIISHIVIKSDSCIVHDLCCHAQTKRRELLRLSDDVMLPRAIFSALPLMPLLLRSRIILRWLLTTAVRSSPRRKVHWADCWFGSVFTFVLSARCHFEWCGRKYDDRLHRWRLRGIICYGCCIISIDVRSLENIWCRELSWHGCYDVVLCGTVVMSRMVENVPLFWCSNNNVTVTSVSPVTAGNFHGMGSDFKCWLCVWNTPGIWICRRRKGY